MVNGNTSLGFPAKHPIVRCLCGYHNNNLGTAPCFVFEMAKESNCTMKMNEDTSLLMRAIGRWFTQNWVKRDKMYTPFGVSAENCHTVAVEQRHNLIGIVLATIANLSLAYLAIKFDGLLAFVLVPIVVVAICFINRYRRNRTNFGITNALVAMDWRQHRPAAMVLARDMSRRIDGKSKFGDDAKYMPTSSTFETALMQDIDRNMRDIAQKISRAKAHGFPKREEKHVDDLRAMQDLAKALGFDTGKWETYFNGEARSIVRIN